MFDFWQHLLLELKISHVSPSKLAENLDEETLNNFIRNKQGPVDFSEGK